MVVPYITEPPDEILGSYTPFMAIKDLINWLNLNEDIEGYRLAQALDDWDGYSKQMEDPSTT